MSKKYLSQFAVIAAVAAMSQGALAAVGDTGHINFEGSISTSICSISAKSGNMTVFLGRPTAGRFKAAGDKAEPVEFSIDLLDCPAVAGDKDKIANVAKVTFDGAPDASAASGGKWLKAGDGLGAQGVAIQITDSTGAQIDMRSPSAAYTLSEGTNSLKFRAAYIATQATVKAGAANGSATFRVDYN